MNKSERRSLFLERSLVYGRDVASLMGPRIIASPHLVVHYLKPLPRWVYMGWLPDWRWCRVLRAAIVKRKRFTANHEFLSQKGWRRHFRNTGRRPSKKILSLGGNTWVMHPEIKAKIENLSTRRGSR